MLLRLSFKLISLSNQILGSIVWQGACKLATFILICIVQWVIISRQVCHSIPALVLNAKYHNFSIHLARGISVSGKRLFLFSFVSSDGGTSCSKEILNVVTNIFPVHLQKIKESLLRKGFKKKLVLTSIMLSPV